jgi:nitrile hydratase
MGLELGEEVESVVRTRAARYRWLVPPERPAGTEDLSEEELTALVTGDAMVGVARVSTP